MANPLYHHHHHRPRRRRLPHALPQEQRALTEAKVPAGVQASNIVPKLVRSLHAVVGPRLVVALQCIQLHPHRLLCAKLCRRHDLQGSTRDRLAAGAEGLARLLV